MNSVLYTSFRPSDTGRLVWLPHLSQLLTRIDQHSWRIRSDAQNHQRHHQEIDQRRTHVDGGGGQQRPHQENLADTSKLRNGMSDGYAFCYIIVRIDERSREWIIGWGISYTCPCCAAGCPQSGQEVSWRHLFQWRQRGSRSLPWRWPVSRCS